MSQDHNTVVSIYATSYTALLRGNESFDSYELWSMYKDIRKFDSMHKATASQTSEPATSSDRSSAIDLQKCGGQSPATSSGKFKKRMVHDLQYVGAWVRPVQQRVKKDSAKKKPGSKMSGDDKK